MNVPWFLPGVAISVLAAVLLATFAGRSLGSSRVVAAALIVSVGAILAATVTPIAASETAGGAGRECDMSKASVIPLSELTTLDDRSLNVLLFVPLGLTIGLVPAARSRFPLLVAATVLPVAIETFQLVAPTLNRGCEASDVVDNVTGIAVGFIAGVVARRLV